MQIKTLYLISSFSYTIFIQSAALLPQSLTSKVTQVTIEASEQLFGQPITTKLIGYTKVGKHWSAWYIRSISNPTPHELIYNSLCYSIEYETRRSITGESPYKSIQRRLLPLLPKSIKSNKDSN